MENNWKEKLNSLLTNSTECWNGQGNLFHREDIINTMLEFGNLVFEATKRECADKAEMTGIAYGDSTSITDYAIDKESILNINKPNL